MENNMSKSTSIFNDVIGPVMRGPSSSHTAASWRIARVCLDILGEPLKKALIEFDKQGAWASNYLEQGTVMGINGGLLGLEITDPRMKDTESVAKEMDIEISYQVSSFPTTHTNTVRLNFESTQGNTLQVIAISTGGGAFEIQYIDNIDVSIKGDCFELLIWKITGDQIAKEIKQLVSGNKLSSLSSSETYDLFNLKFHNEVPNDLIEKLKASQIIEKFVVVKPVLPIVAGNGNELPFDSITSLLAYAEKNNLDLGEIGILYEQCQSGISDKDLKNKMQDIIKIIEKSIELGLSGTQYEDRILQQQSDLIEKAAGKGKIINNVLINNTIAYVTAIMESKSAMEVIVANPTAGSCGTVGGVIKAAAQELGSKTEDIIKAYFAAGIVGVYFANGPGFSAEEHGCQVECGAASGMAAAGIVQLMGGTAKQAIDAASLGIQNMIGLVCDPVADRVEVPCLGKNISAAMNALSSATMAASGFDAVIPLQQVLETVSSVSSQMPTCVKCTGKGGLAITETSFQIKQQLKTNKN
jgi:L-serine dehydratase